MENTEELEGQDYLKLAFTHYYRSFFEQDDDRRSELNLLANLEIGFHEQTRLQPEIHEALTIIPINVEALHKHITDLALANAGKWSQVIWIFKKATGRSILPISVIEQLAAIMEEKLRSVLTAHLMTLSLPPATLLRLGRDLSLDFPEGFRDL